MTTPGPPRTPRWRVFAPILAGANFRGRMIACVGAAIGIALTLIGTGWLMGGGWDVPLIIAPVGASAMLLFAVPTSPLAQPWPIVGGNTISAFIGLVAAQLVPEPALAAGLAVALAIAAMSVTRSLHPPGGAMALIAALGGPTVAAFGFAFPLAPVALNSVILVAVGYAFHRLSRRRYPHRPPPAPVNTHRTVDPPASLRAGFQATDIDAALAALNETFDIDRADIDRLLRQVELQTLIRARGDLHCADIMSRDVIRIGQGETLDAARRLLLDHNIRTLPVVDDDGLLVGTLGLRELAAGAGTVGAAMRPAATARAEAPALSLVPALTDGRRHAVVITDADRHILGLITQTDLLAALARSRTAAGTSP